MSEPLDEIPDEEIYVCQSCGHEDHQDRFGRYCPACGIDLDDFERFVLREDAEAYD